MSTTSLNPVEQAVAENYRKVLRNMVQESSDIPPLDSTIWRRLPPVTNAILVDAYSRQKPLIDQIHYQLKASSCRVKYSTIGRPRPKAIERVREKMTWTPTPGRASPQFKAQNDLIAMRFQVDTPNNVVVLIDELRKMCGKNDDMYFKAQDNVVDDQGMLTDIVSKAVLYSAEVGYLAEIQIAPKFVFHAFKQDSISRTTPEEKLRIDILWDYYDVVKQFMLKYAAGLLTTDIEDDRVKWDIKKFKAITQAYITWLHAYGERIADEEDVVIEETMKPWLYQAWNGHHDRRTDDTEQSQTQSLATLKRLISCSCARREV